ncbi:phosphocholine cytidylyltransferase family protein [uncultured Thioclava sp.]|uniref:phosphocholine cytidylyltransferase family protein n=1 Tax=uncultured Thioclava sp. TaxID=473858 RepID=UPI0025D1B722|nr:phosphocholine cytidylyltransferase family protein [uncultured Thioclava sp.]
MKAVILAAGKGSRIADVAVETPKSLLPLGDTTLLGQSLGHFKAHGVTELVIVTGYKRDMIADYTRQHWDGALEVVYNPHFDRTNVLYSFWLAMPYLGDDDFLFLHADTVFSDEVIARVVAHPSSAQMVFAVDDHPCEEEEMKVLTKSNLVTDVNKQMEPSTCNGEFLGLARVSGEQTKGLRRHAERLFEEGAMQSFFEMAVQRMIDEDGLQVEVCDVTGLPWREVDFPEDYEAARGFFG